MFQKHLFIFIFCYANYILHQIEYKLLSARTVFYLSLNRSCCSTVLCIIHNSTICEHNSWMHDMRALISTTSFLNMSFLELKWILCIVFKKIQISLVLLVLICVRLVLYNLIMFMYPPPQSRYWTVQSP